MRLIKTSINNNGSGTCARIGDVWNEELKCSLNHNL